MIDNSNYKLEKQLAEVEETLTRMARIPILGSAPALLKAGLGVVQLTSAVAIAIVSSPLALAGNEGAKKLVSYSWSHIKHGCGNICSGILLGIPVIGSIAYGILNYGMARGYGIKFDNKQPLACMFYHAVAEEEGSLTWESSPNFLGSHPYDVGSLKDFFEGISAKEARELGLINENYEIMDEQYERLKKDYKNNKIKIKLDFVQFSRDDSLGK